MRARSASCASRSVTMPTVCGSPSAVAERGAALVVDEQERQPVGRVGRGERGDQRLQQLALARAGHAARAASAGPRPAPASIANGPSAATPIGALSPSAVRQRVRDRRRRRLGQPEQLEERDRAPGSPPRRRSRRRRARGARSRATSSHHSGVDGLVRRRPPATSPERTSTSRSARDGVVELGDRACRRPAARARLAREPDTALVPWRSASSRTLGASPRSPSIRISRRPGSADAASSASAAAAPRTGPSPRTCGSHFTQAQSAARRGRRRRRSPAPAGECRSAAWATSQRASRAAAAGGPVRPERATVQRDGDGDVRQRGAGPQPGGGAARAARRRRRGASAGCGRPAGRSPVPSPQREEVRIARAALP